MPLREKNVVLVTDYFTEGLKKHTHGELSYCQSLARNTSRTLIRQLILLVVVVVHLSQDQKLPARSSSTLGPVLRYSFLFEFHALALTHSLALHIRAVFVQNSCNSSAALYVVSQSIFVSLVFPENHGVHGQ